MKLTKTSQILNVTAYSQPFLYSKFKVAKKGYYFKTFYKKPLNFYYEMILVWHGT